MDFTVEFYETKEGRCPVRDFPDDLKASDPGDFAARSRVAEEPTPYRVKKPK